LSHDGECAWKGVVEPFRGPLEIDDVETSLELGTDLFGEDPFSALRLGCQYHQWPS
jgi:hypothetical protein